MNKNKKTFKEITEIDTNCVFHGGHHSLSQLYYMVDTYDKQVLTAYIARKWEYKFNYGNMSDTDYEEFNHEIKILKLNLFEVYAEMEDYGII